MSIILEILKWIFMILIAFLCSDILIKAEEIRYIRRKEKEDSND